MPIRKVKPYLVSLKKELSEWLKLVEISREIQSAYSPPRGAKLTHKEIESISELAFLKVVVGYEIFIENTFLAYMVWAESVRKFKPYRYIFPKDLEHAKNMIRPEDWYINWWKTNKVKARSLACFRDWKPYKENLDLYTQSLWHLNTIRNCIAHNSSEARDKFETTVRAYFGTSKRNQTVWNFLLMQKPGTSKSMLEFFCDELENLANKIVP